MADLHHVICGRRFRIRFAPLRNSHGTCTDPAERSPTITIANNLDDLGTLEAILHEGLHASAYQLLSEEYVETTAHDLARLLARMGYKRK